MADIVVDTGGKDLEETVDDITDELAGKTRTEKSEVKEAVMKAVAQLERFGLVKRI